jgi:hypothetical protein
MNDWLTLAKALNRTMMDHAPGWTDRNDADPGITMLKIIAYLAEGLRLHRGALDDSSSVASQIVHALDPYDGAEPIAVRVNGERWQRVRSLAGAAPGARVFTFDEATGVITFGDGVHGRVPERGSTIFARYRDEVGEEGNTSVNVRSTWPFAPRAWMIRLREEGTIQLEACVILHEHWSGKKRPRFFAGRLLTSGDFVEEQEYHLGKHRHHLQMLHGSGIVHGLQVEAGTGGETIRVQPGLAIDRHGREIYVDAEVTFAVPSDFLSPTWIVVEYVERPADPVPASDGSVESPSRLEEGCHIIVANDCSESGVAVARLIREQDGWCVDPSFVPKRPH